MYTYTRVIYIFWRVLFCYAPYCMYICLFTVVFDMVAIPLWCWSCVHC